VDLLAHGDTSGEDSPLTPSGGHEVPAPNVRRSALSLPVCRRRRRDATLQVAWRRAFVAAGGAKHLLRVMLESELEAFIGRLLPRKALALLLKLVGSFLQVCVCSMWDRKEGGLR
jgi:hypothetical protein